MAPVGDVCFVPPSRHDPRTGLTAVWAGRIEELYAEIAYAPDSGTWLETQLKEKLNKLENLVSSLVSQQTQPNGDAQLQQSLSMAGSSASFTGPAQPTDKLTPSSPDPDHLKESPRPIAGGDGQVSYVDASHWQSVLEELREVRETLATSDVPSVSSHSEGPSTTSPPLSTIPMFSENTPATIEEILTDLPTQPICSSILSQFFNTPYSVLAIVHPEQFRVQYEKFWLAPTEEPDFIWLALLFAILSLALSIRRTNKDNAESSMPSPRTLQKRTSQCLVIGGYTTANRNVLEALLLHMHSSFITDNSSYLQLWLALGHTIQLAYRLAYHREPSKLQNCSVLDAEMRRRVWMHLVQVDALGSFQIGLPSLIQNESYDTSLPGNYEFSDLEVGMTSLPPPRPLTHRTPNLYGISKAPVMAMFKKITQHVQALTPVTYEQTLALDQEMRETYSRVPALIQRRDVDKAFMDISALIWDRATVEILYLKGLIVLHRRYLRHETENPKFDISRSKCVEAALEILARQADLHQASRPGGRLYEDRWILSSVTTTYDFILAAMVLCLDLSMRTKIQPDKSTHVVGVVELDNTAQRELLALKIAHQIWISEEIVFKEVVVAARTLELLIKSVESSAVAASAPGPPPQNGTILNWTSPPPAYGAADSGSNDVAAATHMLSATSVADSSGPPAMADPMWDLIYSNDPLDWPLLDQYFQGSSNAMSYDIGGDWDYSAGLQDPQNYP
ncbi:uncharacterized protein AB675_3049 [Cyphellophora attinorum]|uniref:Xylanolytic transcriptional activator regulatory domain-containing protein n=1 Tax=Cyphellophora attinorum TaxID=1664694 RepID=A0A0N1NYX6_9EURO|nr:uncharacterized protein AB675_3049 [Phialophora attinorum]KPI37886.1 hypothetical protein AB675_3049 [Phialophora attinorum]